MEKILNTHNNKILINKKIMNELLIVKIETLKGNCLVANYIY